MNDPILTALAKDLNDLRERVDAMEGKKTQSPSYKELLDRGVADYNLARNLFWHICDCDDAIDIAKMCKYIQNEYDKLKQERDELKQEVDSLQHHLSHFAKEG